MKNPESELPPGFRFHPTDEELITHYLLNKTASTNISLPYSLSIIADVDIYKFDPWHLPAHAVFGDKEWYFFTPRDRKYPKGARPNRSAASGYWKATGTDKPIFTSRGDHQNKPIGIKKALVFYMGKPPKGHKSDWIMHEYRLSECFNHKPPKLNDSSMRLDEWVLCRIYKKFTNHQTISISDQEEQEDPLITELPQPVSSNLINHNTSFTSILKPQKSSSFSDLFNVVDYSSLSHLLLDYPFDQTGSDFSPILNYGDPINQSITPNNFTKNNNTNYLFHEELHPQIDYPSQVQVMEKNSLKRNLDDEEILVSNPSKRIMVNSCNFTNNSINNQLDPHNQILLNQQFLMGSKNNLQF